MSVNEQAKTPRYTGVRSWLSVFFLAVGAALLTCSSYLPARADDVTAAPPAPSKAGVTHVILRTTLPPLHSTLKAPDTAQVVADNQLSPQPDIYAFHRAQANPVGAVARAIPINLRLGAEISPRVKFDGGLDVTIPGLSLGPGFATRIDVDAIVAANFGGVTTLVPLTFDQVFTLHIPGGPGIYLGGGIGPYFGNVTRFGGKLFAGGLLTSRFGLEGTIHFPGFGDPLLTLQLRIGL